MHDFYEGKELHHWMKHQQSISRVSSSLNKYNVVWRGVNSYFCLHKHKVAFHKTEQVAVSASRDRFIMVWREGEIQALQAFEAHTLPITGLGVSPGKFFRPMTK